MSGTDWIKTLAPLLGTALGGPLGGAAAAFIADKLGIQEKTVTAVSEVLNSGKMNADQIASLKIAEIEFNKFLEANKIKLEELDAADRKSARDMQVATGSWVPGVLAMLVTGGFFGILSWMLYSPDYKPTEPLLVMLGSLGTAWTMIVGFYFGSSQGSRAKTDLIDRMSK
jgi:gas vesicle protein